MDSLAAYFHERVETGAPACDSLAHYYRCVAVGLTKGAEIRATFQSTDPARSPLLLEAHWTRGLVIYEKAFLPGERLMVTRVERSGLRAQVLVTGVESRRVARLYPNFKNSWMSPLGLYVPAENWVRTPCFHVWIT
jgi:hypothetical protein